MTTHLRLDKLLDKIFDTSRAVCPVSRITHKALITFIKVSYTYENMDILRYNPIEYFLMIILGFVINTATTGIIILILGYLGANISLTLENAVIGGLILSTVNLAINIARRDRQ